MTNSSATIGLNFGDEGKGLGVSFQVSLVKNPIVIRFNGGHQVGHTVVYNGRRHVFSNFGSGSLQGAPTYWSQFCTFYPISFLTELRALNFCPVFYIHPLAPVTTPFDVEANLTSTRSSRDGTVGVGFGDTIKRHEAFYKIHAQDLFYKEALRAKLEYIAEYYYQDTEMARTETIENFINVTEIVKKFIKIYDISELSEFTPIYEGAQGILLDQDFGFFPHVTRSNTTTKNAIAIGKVDEVYYVTRTYLTRHGNGYLPNCSIPELNALTDETNTDFGVQGKFRKSQLDYDLLNYSLRCDNLFSNEAKKNLIITHYDRWPINIDLLLGSLNTKFHKVYVSHGPALSDIKLFSN